MNDILTSKINFKIIWTQFNRYWRLILFFAICWFFINLFIILMCYLITKDKSISPYSTYNFIRDDNTNEFIKNGGDYYSGIGSYFPTIYYICGLILFSMCSISFIMITILFDIREGYISQIMTTTIKRNDILFSKIFFCWSALFVSYLPGYLINIILCSFASDANIYLGRIFLIGLSFFIFILALSSLFIFIILIFNDFIFISLSVCGVIVVYLLVVNILQMMITNKEIFNKIGMMLITPNPLEFRHINFSLPANSDLSQYKIEVYDTINNESLKQEWITLPINMTFAVFISYSSIIYFKKMDLRI
ncbi:hypothetical protein [Spiroplasma endosymbiont of Aspidapion aeneum]|uniref:hypothetical protein n=1 Tax=Spiroplasma endosymbiont of Aspidapion aeneum TaxID=3066276 RepID=UPI00313BDAEC